MTIKHIAIWILMMVLPLVAQNIPSGYPKYILLDEIDSGLDVDAFRDVAELLKSVDDENNCFIIITHLFTILEYLSVRTQEIP